MTNLIEINNLEDIPENYRETPIGSLLKYHNLQHEYGIYPNARLLVGMCMDNRKHLKIPDNFAFILRTGGANLQHSEFKVSYALSVGNVRHIALIGHNNCGMVNLPERKDQFIKGLVESGWDEKTATEHFNHYSPLFEIGDEKTFILSEANRLRKRYPKIQVAPFIYKVENNKLYLIKE